MQHQRTQALAQLAAVAGGGAYDVQLVAGHGGEWATAQGVLANGSANDGVARATLLALAEQQAAGGPVGGVGEPSGDADDYDGPEPGASAPSRPSKRGRGAASSQADYALRHQAAEQRRRARINERLDALRKLVPHDPRANTASFLEDVIKHILMLKDTNEKLEQALGAMAGHPAQAGVAAASHGALPPAQVPQHGSHLSGVQPAHAASVVGHGAAAAAANGRGTPPPPPPLAHGTSLVREAHSLQQLLSHAQQAGGGVLGRGGGGGGGAGGARAQGGAGGQHHATITMTSHNPHGVDVDIAPVQQHVLLASTASTEQHEALLRSLMGTSTGGATAMQLLSGALPVGDGGAGGVGPGHGGGGATLEQLLSAASQLAGGGGGVQVTDDAGNVVHLRS